jgi:hypothetical protein
VLGEQSEIQQTLMCHQRQFTITLEKQGCLVKGNPEVKHSRHLGEKLSPSGRVHKERFEGLGICVRTGLTLHRHFAKHSHKGEE